MIPFVRVSIFNMLGTEILQKDIGQADRIVLSLEGFPPGIYIVRVDDGESTESVRVIRQ